MIILFKKSRNYNTWAEKIQGLSTLDKFWLITIGEPLQPKSSMDLPLNIVNTTNVAGMSSGTIVTDKKRENYELKFEKYELQIADWDKKHAIVWEIIRLNCKLRLRIQVKDVHLATAFWDIFKKQYELTDLATKNEAPSMMIQNSRKDFKTMAKYGESIKKRAAKRTEMGSLDKP